MTFITIVSWLFGAIFLLGLAATLTMMVSIEIIDKIKHRKK